MLEEKKKPHEKMWYRAKIRYRKKKKVSEKINK